MTPLDRERHMVCGVGLGRAPRWVAATIPRLARRLLLLAVVVTGSVALAETLYNEGNFSDAIAPAKEAIALSESTVGSDDPLPLSA